MEASRLLEAGIVKLEEGSAGNSAAVLEAIELFERALELDSESQAAQAYLGKSLVIRARDASMFRRLEYVKQGFRKMDQAVDRDPEHVETRLLRAFLSYQVPGFLNRKGIATEDFSFLLERANRGDANISEPLLRRIYFHAGAFALENGDPAAIDLLAQAKSISADKPSSERVETKLKAASERFGGSSSP